MAAHVWKLTENTASLPAAGAMDADERAEERQWLDRCAEGDERAVAGC